MLEVLPRQLLQSGQGRLRARQLFVQLEILAVEVYGFRHFLAHGCNAQRRQHILSTSSGRREAQRVTRFLTLRRLPLLLHMPHAALPLDEQLVLVIVRQCLVTHSRVHATIIERFQLDVGSACLLLANVYLVDGCTLRLIIVI